MLKAFPSDAHGIPETLEEAMSLPSGPIAKFYMVKHAPRSMEKGILRTLSCDQIRKALGNWFPGSA